MYRIHAGTHTQATDNGHYNGSHNGSRNGSLSDPQQVAHASQDHGAHACNAIAQTELGISRSRDRAITYTGSRDHRPFVFPSFFLSTVLPRGANTAAVPPSDVHTHKTPASTCMYNLSSTDCCITFRGVACCVAYYTPLFSLVSRTGLLGCQLC